MNAAPERQDNVISFQWRGHPIFAIDNFAVAPIQMS